MTYHQLTDHDRPLRWLHGELKTPPLASAARVEMGYLLRCLQRGQALVMPQSRPMLTVSARCHELRVNSGGSAWRLIYRIDEDAIVILDVFDKKTRTTPQRIIAACRRRLRIYDHAAG